LVLLVIKEIKMNTHYFDIGNTQFVCRLEDEYSHNGHSYWMPDNNSGFNIDFCRAFRTKEACEKYMKSMVKKTSEEMLKCLEKELYE